MSQHNDHLGSGTLSRPQQDQQWLTNLSYADFISNNFGAEIAVPGFRSSGYDEEDIVAHEHFNYFLKLLGAWTVYLDSKLTGEYGELDVIEDTSSLYEMALQAGTNGNASTRSFAVDRLRTNIVRQRALVAQTNEDIDFKDLNDQAADLWAANLFLNSSHKVTPDDNPAITSETGYMRLLDPNGDPSDVKFKDVRSDPVTKRVNIARSDGTLPQNGADTELYAGSFFAPQLMSTDLIIPINADNNDLGGPDETPFVNFRDPNTFGTDGSAGIWAAYAMAEEGQEYVDIREPSEPNKEGSGDVKLRNLRVGEEDEIGIKNENERAAIDSRNTPIAQATLKGDGNGNLSSVGDYNVLRAEYGGGLGTEDNKLELELTSAPSDQLQASGNPEAFVKVEMNVSFTDSITALELDIVQPVHRIDDDDYSGTNSKIVMQVLAGEYNAHGHDTSFNPSGSPEIASGYSDAGDPNDIQPIKLGSDIRLMVTIYNTDVTDGPTTP
jgi:hypothetical protein